MNVSVIDLFFVFVCAVLSGMGVGGGGLLLIYFTLFRHYDIFLARQLNLYCFLFSCSASLLRRPSKAENYRPLPRWQWMILFSVGACFALLGRWLLLRFPATQFSLLYGIFFCVSAGISLYPKKKEE